MYYVLLLPSCFIFSIHGIFFLFLSSWFLAFHRVDFIVFCWFKKLYLTWLFLRLLCNRLFSFIEFTNPHRLSARHTGQHNRCALIIPPWSLRVLLFSRILVSGNYTHIFLHHFAVLMFFSATALLSLLLEFSLQQGFLLTGRQPGSLSSKGAEASFAQKMFSLHTHIWMTASWM